MPTEINKTPEPEPESVLERIPRLWAEGKLYFMDDDGVVRPFPKPGVGEVER